MTGRARPPWQVRPSQFAYVDAITHFARALGAARTGNPDAAKADIAQLAALREKLRQAKDAYWSEQVDIQWQVASAWVLHAEGKYEQALAMMSERSRRGRQNGEIDRHAGAAGAGARALRLHAARSRYGERGARRL